MEKRNEGKKRALITEKIVDLLEEQGRKDKEFCDYIGVSQSTFVNWKNRGTNPKPQYLNKAAEFFGVSVNDLLNTEQPTVVIDRSGSMNVDISKELNHALELLSTDNALYFDGEPMSEDTYELLKSAMEIMLTSAKKMSKK